MKEETKISMIKDLVFENQEKMIVAHRMDFDAATARKIIEDEIDGYILTKDYHYVNDFSDIQDITDCIVVDISDYYGSRVNRNLKKCKIGVGMKYVLSLKKDLSLFILSVEDNDLPKDDNDLNS